MKIKNVFLTEKRSDFKYKYLVYTATYTRVSIPTDLYGDISHMTRHMIRPVENPVDCPVLF